MQDLNRLIWIDLEMTGLDPSRDVIIEIATIVTDADLKIISEGPSLVIHQPDDILDGMDAWNTRQHGESGLTERVLASTLSLQEAEKQTIEFLEGYVDHDASPMCGNSICQDRRFLYRYMPKLSAYLHYRNVDVSTIKELVARWSPDIVAGFEKKAAHRALDDIRESIEELQYYRSTVFKV